MSNQEKKNSLFQPVGKAQAMTGTNVAWTMAVFEGSQVPVDAELYLQPSEGRLKLEVEVANDNALHWHNNLVATQGKYKLARMRVRQLERRKISLEAELKRAKEMLLGIHDSQYPSPTSTDIYQFLFGKRK